MKTEQREERSQRDEDTRDVEIRIEMPHAGVAGTRECKFVEGAAVSPFNLLCLPSPTPHPTPPSPHHHHHDILERDRERER